MKFLAICALLLCATAVVLADDDEEVSCQDDTGCRRDECCVLSFLGDIKVCREAGDDHGEFCGGRHFCPYCRGSYDCVASSQAINDVNGCAPAANGTCVRRPIAGRPRF